MSRSGAPLGRLIRNIFLWLLPVAGVWYLATPFYNRLLEIGAQDLLRLAPGSVTTHLVPEDPHHAAVVRSDLPGGGRGLPEIRVTDIHFNLILLAALFLAVPDVPLGQRAKRLGWALLVAVYVHLVSLVAWVKFILATQVAGWSAAHYGTFAQNFYGLSKHLLDLPFKFALPLLLWSAFYLGRLLPTEAAGERPGLS